MAKKEGYEEINLPLRLPSRNLTNKWHWSKKSKEKSIYKLLIRNQMRLKKIQKTKPKEKFLIAIISYRKRLLDYDNLDVKLILDALCDEGFIWDDAPKYIKKPIIEQHKDKNERIQIIRYSFKIS
tara:strand:+ start:7058 stop:7432 length:375 start_codon:yes stop_codon:yes gene_type:complete